MAQVSNVLGRNTLLDQTLANLLESLSLGYCHMLLYRLPTQDEVQCDSFPVWVFAVGHSLNHCTNVSTLRSAISRQKLT